MATNKNATNWTIETVKEYIESYGCTLLDTEYKNMKKTLTIVCRECGNPYYCSFDSFKNAKYKMCRKCIGKKHPANQKYNIKSIKQIAQQYDVTVLSKEYVDNYSNMIFLCPCGSEFTTSWNEFLNGGKKLCNSCSFLYRGYNHRLKIDELKIRVREMSDCELLSNEYITAHELLTFKCSCGKTFERSWANFTNEHKQRCGSCAKEASMMEKEVKRVLENMGVEYIFQHRFDDCRYKYPLPYDFYIPELNICIETDGMQHYEPVEFFGGQEAYEMTKLKDQIKTTYCDKNGIKLIRIPYWDKDNIESILKNALRKVA